VSISDFVRLPTVPGARRVKAPAIAVSAARQAPARQAAPACGVPVLHLACALTEDQVSGLAAAVLARLAGLRQEVGTVVLDLGSGPDLDGHGREEL